MTKEEKMKKVKDVLREKMNFMQCPPWRDAVEAVVDALKEESDDDLTPGDICYVWDEGRSPNVLCFYCGSLNGEKRFSVSRVNIGHPDRGPSYDHYRKIDTWDLLSEEIHALHLFDEDGSIVERLERPEGR